jgi:phage tail sheath gpL-like
MALSQSSREAVVGASVDNVIFQPTAEVLPRKILVIGTYDEATYTTVTENVPQLATSPEDVGSKTGFGFMLHRLVKQAYAGSNGIELWWVAQPEDGAAVVATGTITYVGTITEAGTIYLYVAGIAVPVTVATGDDATAIATATVAAITANDDLPVTATSALGVVTVTSKAKGPWGNSISLTFNWGFQEEFPAGLTSATVVDMASGAGIPDIDDALNGLGTGDDANEDHFTDVVHGYLQDSATLNKVSVYNGVGDTFSGLYSKTVARPFRSLVGDVAAGSSGLSNLVSLGDGRKTDRTNGVIAVPGSPNHPAEVAALAIGIMANINNNRAEQNYIGQILTGVIPGAVADRWTSLYDNRDTAVKAGASPTTIDGGAVIMSSTMSFYHPDSVPASSNGYANMRNISIVQNMLFNVQANFSSENWQGVSLVSDTARVTNIVDRQKARDLEAVKDDLIALANSFEQKAWIYTAAYTIENISVQIRTLNNGFDAIMPVILSISGEILDTTIEFDTSIAVLL